MSWIQMMRPILSLSFQDLKAEVISELNDQHAKDIVDLLRYDENSAGD
jgi:hypothetical protein